ncbi:hypothetical protein [Massilia glaciei]|uniref:Lipoprotein n=1 Tax=Massilia glaciei TaxID=1524097 RepID=A0A2U2I506_9BURK|nr:hypothetical protein [Massilia glaciei]PWF54772.1 hypothetical protein C7C56_005215 [Massilia glaciei]
MKHVLVMLLAVLALGACRTNTVQRSSAPAPVRAAPAQLVDVDGAPIERVGFRPGVSTVTVENLAKGAGCRGGVGASLLTEPGPVEIYRMACDNGQAFMARCELRQCKAVARKY